MRACKYPDFNTVLASIERRMLVFWQVTPILLSIICSALPLCAWAQQEDVSGESPPENPPQILIACSIDAEGNLVLVHYKTIFIGFTGESYNERYTTKVLLKDVQILTVDGTEMTIEAARKRIAERDTPILATSYKTAFPKFYAEMFAPATLHFIWPEQAPQWKQIQEPGRPVQK
jgi:hypothetical protein